VEFNLRSQSLNEANNRNQTLILICGGMAIAILLMTVMLFSQSKIVVLQTPGMPSDSVIERTSMDKGAQRAVLQAVTSNMSQTNPANYEYQKLFLQSFLSPEIYSKVSLKIDARVKQMLAERELGSSYFVFKRYSYDANLNKHFVVGEVHTVNAAKDTMNLYTYEYELEINNYRPVITDILIYPGESMHDTQWIANQKK